MLLTHSDLAVLFTLDETSVEPPKPEQPKQGVPNSRFASFSGACVLALCACGYLPRSDWQSRLLAGWALLELWHFVYQKSRYAASLYGHGVKPVLQLSGRGSCPACKPLQGFTAAKLVDR